MGRKKEFPEKLYVVMRKDNSLCFITQRTARELDELYADLEVRFAEYSISKDRITIFKKPRKPPKSAQTPAVIRKTCLDSTASEKPQKNKIIYYRHSQRPCRQQ